MSVFYTGDVGSFPKKEDHMENDTIDEVEAMADRKLGLTFAPTQFGDPGDGPPVRDGRYQVISFWKRWWTPILRVVVHDRSFRWMEATKFARDIVHSRGCTKSYIVLKMRRYTNPGAVKQSVVELLSRRSA